MRVMMLLLVVLLGACGSAPPKADAFSVPDPAPYDNAQGVVGGAIIKGILP
jgi:uncharacterized lipoprotein YmbA